MPHYGKHIGVNLLSARRSDALLRTRTSFHALGRRQLQTLSPLVLAVAVVVASGSLGAGIALLVADPRLGAEDPASASPSSDVQDLSRVFPRADRAAVSEDELAIEESPREPNAITVSSRTTPFAVEGGRTATGAGADRGPMTRGEGQPGQGGTAVPPADQPRALINALPGSGVPEGRLPHTLSPTV